MYQNVTEGKFKFFDEKRSKSTSNYNLEPGLCTSIRYCGSHDYAHSRERKQPQRNLHNSQGFSQNAKFVIVLANDTSGLAFWSTDLGQIFGNNVGNEFGLLMVGKVPHEPEIA